MAEYIIFERSIVRNDPIHDIFIKIVCDQPNEIRRYTPVKFTISEIVNAGGIVASLLINDANGDLFNHMKLNTSATFNVSFGHSIEDSVSADMKILSFTQVNQTLGRPHDMQLQINFGSPSWFNMTVAGKSKGWSDKTYGEVVSDVVSDFGFSETDISETDGTFKSIVQPNWNNKKFIEYIAARSKPVGETSYGHFLFGVDTENKFTFKPYNKIVEDAQRSIAGGRIPIIRMDTPPESNRETERALQDNDYFSTTFTGINVVEDYAKGCKNGASGGSCGHYDWETGEFVRTGVSFSEMAVPQLSDYSSLRDETGTTEIYCDYGSDVNSEVYLKNIVSKQNLNINKVNIATYGMSNVHIFDFVEIVIPNTSLGSTVPVNEMYSGFYMVSSVKHTFSFDQTVTFTTEAVLMRHGVDNYDYDGFEDLVSSSAGKIV